MLSEPETRIIRLAKGYAADPFPFPNASLLLLISRLADQVDEAAKEIDRVYEERNALVMLAGALARQNRLHGGLGLDPQEPDWPVLFINLPTGQVSWHLPRLSQAYPKPYRRAMAVMSRSPYYSGWDGHTPEEKNMRVLEYAAT